MFRSMTIIRELVLELAKVTIVKSSVKIRRYTLCSGVACYSALHTAYTPIDLT